MTSTTKILYGIIALSMLNGCSYRLTHSYQVPSPPQHSADNYFTAHNSQLSIKAYTYMLADELLNQTSPDTLYKSIAVAGFVDQISRIDQLQSGSELKGLGMQLEAGFIYELSKRGYNVLDYKVRDAVQVTHQGDRIWSRDTDHLTDEIDAGFLLSGTLTEHEKGVVVNVRIVRFDNKKVIAAAQGYVPNSVFWSEQEVTLRDGYLMHKGERKRSY
jgi:TolB-like protein